MAFVAVLPAVGGAVLPALGAIGTGLGGALATGAGAIGSGLAGLGGALSSVPLIGSIASPILSGVGGTIGALGGGLGGGLSALGAGNIGGALSSLGSGVLGAGGNLLGGLGGVYGGLDKMAGGLLPNLGGVGITPQQGFLGQNGLGLLGTPKSQMAGGMSMDNYIANEMAMNPMNGVDRAASIMDQMGGAGLTQPGGPQSILDRGKAMLGGIKDAVDPVLGPVTEVGQALGAGMDIYNQITGAGQPQAGGTTTPAQAAQIGQYNRFVPTTKVAPQIVPVNVGAASGAVPATATPAMQGMGAPQSYVPMPMLNMEDRVGSDEEEAAKFKELLAGNANFLSGVAGRMNA